MAPPGGAGLARQREQLAHGVRLEDRGHEAQERALLPGFLAADLLHEGEDLVAADDQPGHRLQIDVAPHDAPLLPQLQRPADDGGRAAQGRREGVPYFLIVQLEETWKIMRAVPRSWFR
jgi:hypothetical protein